MTPRSPVETRTNINSDDVFVKIALTNCSFWAKTQKWQLLQAMNRNRNKRFKIIVEALFPTVLELDAHLYTVSPSKIIDISTKIR